MAKRFYDRYFPVRPNLEQLKHQAKDMLRAIGQGDDEAAAELGKPQPKPVAPSDAKLADAQLVLALSYGLSCWPRLVTACGMTDAIWRGDVDAVRALITKNPRLLHEAARGIADSNWGPPMSGAPRPRSIWMSAPRPTLAGDGMGGSQLLPAYPRGGVCGRQRFVVLI